MSNFWNFTQSKFLALFILGGVSSSQLAHAQNDFEIGKKSKELVDEMKKEEQELRAETKKKITEKREQAIKSLENLLVKYAITYNKEESDLIKAEINKLKKKMGIAEEVEQLAVDDKPLKEAISNQYFKYETSYLFDEKDVIKGQLVFMQNQKVRASYHYKGNQESDFWEWKDMGDHVQINTDSPLGTIIVSERPNSNLKSLLIRWGGELKNKLTDANSE